jgi:hypothetical protein
MIGCVKVVCATKIKRNDVQLTELLSPFNESLSHFRKSCEGGTGVSSTLGIEADLGAEISLDAVGPLVRTVDKLAELGVEVEGVIIGRTAPVGVADIFPVAPTVVHAPPLVWTDNVLYSGSEKFAWLMTFAKALTLFVVSAYPLRAAVTAAAVSLIAIFFRLSSSSCISFMLFFVCWGFPVLVHTGVLGAGGLEEFVAGPSFGETSVRTPAREVGSPQEAVNDCESSPAGVAEVAARAARSLSAALRASNFLASAS